MSNGPYDNLVDGLPVWTQPVAAPLSTLYREDVNELQDQLAVWIGPKEVVTLNGRVVYGGTPPILFDSWNWQRVAGVSYWTNMTDDGGAQYGTDKNIVFPIRPRVGSYCFGVKLVIAGTTGSLLGGIDFVTQVIGADPTTTTIASQASNSWDTNLVETTVQKYTTPFPLYFQADTTYYIFCNSTHTASKENRIHICQIEVSL